MEGDEAREKAQRGAIFDAAQFQEMVEFVLEGTLFNLVSEISHGEFVIDHVPRQIVRSLQITDEEVPPPPKPAEPQEDIEY